MDKKCTISIVGAGWLGMPLAKEFDKKRYTVKASTTTPSKITEMESHNIRGYCIKITPEPTTEIDKNFFDSDIIIINIPPKRIENIESIYPLQIKNIVSHIPKDMVRQIIFISSTSVYPSFDYNDYNIEKMQEVDETCNIMPKKSNGIAIISAENIIQNAFPSQWVVLRLGGLYGPKRPIGKFLLRKKIPKIHPLDRVNLVHRDDCICIIQQLIHRKVVRETFNVVCSEHPLKKDLYTQKALKLGLPKPNFVYSSTPLGKVVSNKKIQKFLDYSFLPL